MYSNNEKILSIPRYLFLHQYFSQSQHPQLRESGNLTFMNPCIVIWL